MNRKGKSDGAEHEAKQISRILRLNSNSDLVGGLSFLIRKRIKPQQNN